jgi:ubiquinone/menaquinone biosynthesis C-methylase UbiE
MHGDAEAAAAMRVNYDSLAARYDRHRRGGGPFMPTLTGLAGTCPGTTVLELGSGTGNNTRAFLDAYPCRITGVDASRAMLRVAQAKGLDARWVRAGATALPLAGQSVDFIFAVCVLHHIPDMTSLFRECGRVLRPGGIAAFVTSPHDFIERHPMNRYFPSFAAVDKARFQDVPEILRAIESTGFERSGVQHDVAPAHPIDYAYYERVAGRFISTYDLIPTEELEAGLARFEADLAQMGALNVSIAWECATVWGRV